MEGKLIEVTTLRKENLFYLSCAS